MWAILLSSWITDLATIVKLWRFSTLFKGKLSYELNFIFMYSFRFIVLIGYLISSWSSVYFVSNSLLLSVEAKIKYLFLFFSPVYPSALPIIKCKGFTLLILKIIKFLYYHISNVININIFVSLFCLFLVSVNQSF